MQSFLKSPYQRSFSDLICILNVNSADEWKKKMPIDWPLSFRERSCVWNDYVKPSDKLEKGPLLNGSRAVGELTGVANVHIIQIMADFGFQGTLVL